MGTRTMANPTRYSGQVPLRRRCPGGGAGRCSDPGRSRAIIVQQEGNKMIEAIERMERVMRQNTKSPSKVKPWRQLGHILVAADLSDEAREFRDVLPCRKHPRRNCVGDRRLTRRPSCDTCPGLQFAKSTE